LQAGGSAPYCYDPLLHVRAYVCGIVYELNGKTVFVLQVACGKEIRYESKTDSALAKELLETAKLIKVPAISGNTMATHDFYEGIFKLHVYMLGLAVD